MTGGDILEISYNNDDVGSGVLFCKSAEDSNFQPGGIISTDDENMVATNGEMIDQMQRVRWNFETTLAWDMNVARTLETILALQRSTKQTAFTISHINGVVYEGFGKPVGVHVGNGNQATIPLKLQGGGELKPQL